MVKSIHILLVVILMTMSNSALSGELDKQLHQKCLYPTVMIFSVNPNVKSSGTGVIIKSIKKGEKYLNLVGTCAHILQKSPPVYQYEYDKNDPTLVIESKLITYPKYDYMLQVGIYKDWSKLVGVERFDCKIEAVDEEKDIALLTFESKKEMSTVDLELNPDLFIGNDVLRIGCGAGLPYRLDYGKITSMPNTLGFLSGLEGTYRTSIATVNGDSGGPVFHNYKLIGVMQAVMGGNGNQMMFHMSYVIPLERFVGSEIARKFLKTEKEFSSLVQEDAPDKDLKDLLDEIDALN